MRSSEGLERYITAKIKAFSNALETSVYGEIETLNEETVDVYLPSRDLTLFDIPVFTLQGGGEYLQFPVAVGNKCLIVFTKDSAVDWLSGNSISSSYNFDLSNGFALVGLDTIVDPLPLVQITTMNVTKMKIQNDTAELITEISNLLQALIDAVVPTVTGPQPLSTKADIITIKSKIDTFKG